MSQQIIRPVRAQVGEVVEILWRDAQGNIWTERRTAPPPDVWRVRTQATEAEPPEVGI